MKHNCAKNKRVLIIVAHPDDETIWMGGALLKNKNNWDTTIISLCRRDDKDREPRFRNACEIYNAESCISDLEDENLGDVNLREIIKRIRRFTRGKKYRYIFTHGKNGEYGHKRHIDVNRAVVEMLNKKLLSAEKVFFFSYIKKSGICSPNKNSDKFIYLNDLIFNEKRCLIRNIYNFKPGSFEDMCCKNLEAFNIRI